jgi:branched-subunit amino acid aminotransferase/4-amino-4-deoxychorismate lyase
MMLSTTLILILLTSSIAYPHHQQLHSHGQQDVILVTNYNYVTETTGVTAAIWVQGGVVPHGSSVPDSH